MRCFVVIGMIVAFSASANAATMHHAKPRVMHYRISHLGPTVSGAWARLGAPTWSYERPRPPDIYDDTPSYDDPSKRGGE